MFRLVKRAVLFVAVGAVAIAVFGVLPTWAQAAVSWGLGVYLVRAGWSQIVADLGRLTGRVPRGRHGGLSFARGGRGDL